MSATATEPHPAVAETQRLYLDQAVSLMNLLDIALEGLEDSKAAPFKLTLKSDRRTCDVQPFRELRARMYCRLVRLGEKEFALPLEIRNLGAPSQWALLFLEETRRPNLMFHSFGSEIAPEMIDDLRDRSEYFRDLRSRLDGNRGIPGGRKHKALLVYIDQNKWPRPEEDHQIARELVNRHFGGYRLDA